MALTCQSANKYKIKKAVIVLIKGVNKQIVEINCTRDEYIEKAILFVNPQKMNVSKAIIAKKAQEYLVETGGVFMETKNESLLQKKLFYSSIAGGIIVSILAVLFHFIYEWSGENPIVGLFSATNESVFEHIKILYFPFLLYITIEYLVIRPEWKRYFAGRLAALLLLPILVIAVFYTYTGIVGEHIALVDIISAFLYVGLAFYISYLIIKSKKNTGKAVIWLIPAAIATTAAIFYFSLYPAHIPLFFDSTNKIYGML